MNSREKLRIDGVLLGSMLVTSATGLVLLLAFHVEHGRFRPEWLGLSRLAWQNIHRFGAILALASVAAHATANARSIGARLRRLTRQDVRELAYYATIATVCMAGFAAWLFVDGSIPLFGPVRLGRVSASHHRWIDVHNVAAILSLYPTTSHVRRRWRALCALGRRNHQGDRHEQPAASEQRDLQKQGAHLVG